MFKSCKHNHINHMIYSTYLIHPFCFPGFCLHMICFLTNVGRWTKGAFGLILLKKFNCSHVAEFLRRMQPQSLLLPLWNLWCGLVVFFFFRWESQIISGHLQRFRFWGAKLAVDLTELCKIYQKKHYLRKKKSWPFWICHMFCCWFFSDPVMSPR